MTETQKNPLAENFNAISLIRFAFPSMVTILLVFVVGNMIRVLYQNLFVTAGKPTLGLVLVVLAGIAEILKVTGVWLAVPLAELSRLC